MQKTIIQIGVVTSSETMAHYIQQMEKSPEYRVTLSMQGLENALADGRSMQESGVEVIVSRKGTSYLLREHLHIPVLSVPQSSLDLITALKKAASLGEKIFIPNFREHISGLDLLAQLLQLEINQSVYLDTRSLYKTIHQARLHGSEVVVGGGLAVRYAREQSLQGVEIQASDESIRTALDSAYSVVLSNRKEKARMRRLYSIIDAVSEGIVSVNQKGVIMTVNNAARKIFRLGEQDITSTDYHIHFPWGQFDRVLETQQPVHDRTEKIHGQLYLINYEPVMLEMRVVGCIATFQEAFKLMRSEKEVRRSLTKGLYAKYSISDLIYKSSAMKGIVEVMQTLSHTDCTVLITGETGTGKEIIAQGIHNLSSRQKKPFISINCAALPEDLLESELFGYEGGAFTGSKKSGKSGLFEMAHSGTILLDEVSATSAKVQSLLLRVLQEREIMKVGGDRLIPVDVRVIANSNKELVDEVARGQFREDLYFRLNVLQIDVPPLRQRAEDIPLLTQEFIDSTSKRHGLNSITVPTLAMDKLMSYSWPGNVRQLINFIEQLVLLCQSRFRQQVFERLFDKLLQYPLISDRYSMSQERETQNVLSEDSGDSQFQERVKSSTREHETRLIRLALDETGHNKQQAAALLGISRTTLYKKIKKLQI